MTVTWGLVLEYEFADPKASVAGFGLMALRTGPDCQGVRSREGLCAQHLHSSRAQWPLILPWAKPGSLSVSGTFCGSTASLRALWGRFCAVMAEWSREKGLHCPQSLKYLPSGHLQKKSAHPLTQSKLSLMGFT